MRGTQIHTKGTAEEAEGGILSPLLPLPPTDEQFGQPYLEHLISYDLPRNSGYFVE